MYRTISARFQVRNNLRKHQDSLWLMSPYPKRGDYEWGIRMFIDKWFLMQMFPKLNDMGSASSGLCMAAGNLSNADDYCNGCPIKKKTGAAHCDNTPMADMPEFNTYDEFKGIYHRMQVMAQDLYLELFGVWYEPKMFEEE